ncbi:MAG: GNAT family N-acetyltransferase [Deltaproteobacteria bacterium]|nr:GNAT family N-acetyltransferase [Deltaproteobacteria bacterium]
MSQWTVDPKNLAVTASGQDVAYYFHRPEDMPEDMLDGIRELVESGGEVGVSWIRQNLKKAYLVAYAVSGGKVVGVMTHKRPLPEYVREIERKTQLNLQGYLERGYSWVRPEYRGRLVGDRMLKGLVDRSPGEKLYVTIRMDNEPAVRLTLRNRMRLAASFHNERTGHDIGVFINQ